MAPGSTETRSVNVRLPVDWVGSGYLVVRSDSRDDVYELNNDNNTSLLPINVGDDRPDLNITAFEPRLGTREFRPGASFAFDYEVTNQEGEELMDRVGQIVWCYLAI